MDIRSTKTSTSNHIGWAGTSAWELTSESTEGAEMASTKSQHSASSKAVKQLVELQGAGAKRIQKSWQRLQDLKARELVDSVQAGRMERWIEEGALESVYAVKGWRPKRSKKAQAKALRAQVDSAFKELDLFARLLDRADRVSRKIARKAALEEMKKKLKTVAGQTLSVQELSQLQA